MTNPAGHHLTYVSMSCWSNGDFPCELRRKFEVVSEASFRLSVGVSVLTNLATVAAFWDKLSGAIVCKFHSRLASGVSPDLPAGRKIARKSLRPNASKNDCCRCCSKRRPPVGKSVEGGIHSFECWRSKSKLLCRLDSLQHAFHSVLLL